MSLIPVAEALERILDAFEALPAEDVALADALGRVLAEDVIARRTQPPNAVSAMDGYAVRSADVASVPVVLTRIGEAPAGGAFDGTVGAGQTVRIFTGGPVPDGADAIVIQEDTDADGDQITIKEGVSSGRYVRPAGLDFKAGDTGLAAGRALSARDIALAGAMNYPWLRVSRRPRVAILATGDEIVMPGEPIGDNQIVSSNSIGLAAFVTACGGAPTILGIAPDESDVLAAMARGARGADLLVTTGGVSVGEHDLVRAALDREGLAVDFWRIAMRPGKPLMFGHMGDVPVLGLPGNPVSAMVCSLVFLRPLLERLLGKTGGDEPLIRARLASSLAENDRRQDYLRARLTRDADGALVADVFSRQDSSMLAILAQADGLIVRPPFAPSVPAGSEVDVMPFPAGTTAI